MNKVVIITGASSGIGNESAKLFAQNGYRVFATARSLDRMKDLEALGCITVRLDVTDEASIQQAFQQIFAQTDQVDVLVNNAGFSQNGFLEELTPQHLRYQFDVNVFGLVRVTQMVLPKMRQARRGRIINVGSVGGEFTTPGASAYHASKYALESLTDGLRQEVNQFGIQVVLIKPGGVETEFVSNSTAFYPEPIDGNPYGDWRQRFTNMLATVVDSQKSSFPILTPVEVAEVIVQAAAEPEPQTRYRIGETAQTMPQLKGSMSDKEFDGLMLKQFGFIDG
ncbi:putative short-chain type dehydrogenase/reductase vdlC [Fibrisoma limi BUZ 3]|uniref:Putative short-chain type dehydrogenase/reductase vdlC n=1 Tax=Fibrisoma limi BUZ 3 TaxID=1185876 RepID=I2GGA3_9BACT|nr:SDR family NAD(P)-dependent oxidoreductase [Fibrisoma limi]CCH52928.1 putative short-chain type dehydrogenase/reductase vdlC [Fibrisoma limi BUZ 3]